MPSDSSEWLLLNVRRGSPRELTRHLQSMGLEAFVPVLSPMDESAESEDLLPGYVLADAILEEIQSDTASSIDWSIITNRSNRPFVIPGAVAMALKSPGSDASGEFFEDLRALPADYRIERLIVECTRWQIGAVRK